jgi:hypothetical protein
VLLGGCRRERERITALPAAPSTSASASVGAIGAKAVDRPCTAPGVAPRIVVADPIEIHCWPEQQCKSQFSYAIENCTDQPIQLENLFFKGGHHSELVATDLDPPQTIAPRTVHTIDYPFDGSSHFIEPGDYGLVAGIRPVSSDAGVQVLEASFSIVDPAREEARLECLARGDDWGTVGLFGTLRCATVMKDEGKVCHDEADCGGYCIFEREVAISKTEKQVFGRCSRTHERFGCHAMIPKTPGGKGIISIHLKFPRVCVD